MTKAFKKIVIIPLALFSTIVIVLIILFVADRIHAEGLPCVPYIFSNCVSTFAGCPKDSWSGRETGYRNGLKTDALFRYPQGIAIDKYNTIYIADTLNNVIRKVSQQGVVSTFAGTTESGYKDGPCGVAMFDFPSGIANDDSGNIYVLESIRNRIRKISPDCNVTTLAGNGNAGNQDGPGISATFNVPAALAVGHNGSIYVADTGNNSIRIITANREVSTFAGSGKTGDRDGQGVLAELDSPIAVTIDKRGFLYVLDGDVFHKRNNLRIRKVSPTGAVTTRNIISIKNLLDILPPEAVYLPLASLTVDVSGNLYLSDYHHHRILRISVTGDVSQIAGDQNQGYRNGPGSFARFYRPASIAFNTQGDLFVVEVGNSCLRRIVP